MTRAERLRHEATARESARLHAWLRRISWRARGMGRGLAMQAIYSKRWPDEEPTRSKAMRNSPDYKIADTEERELAFLVETKKAVVRTLARVLEAREARGEEDIGVREAVDLEETITRGYELALKKRRDELKGAR